MHRIHGRVVHRADQIIQASAGPGNFQQFPGKFSLDDVSMRQRSKADVDNRWTACSPSRPHKTTEKEDIPIAVGAHEFNCAIQLLRRETLEHNVIFKNTDGVRSSIHTSAKALHLRDEVTALGIGGMLDSDLEFNPVA
jgi:hypothetical protein